jgi:hypothetical protein
MGTVSHFALLAVQPPEHSPVELSHVGPQSKVIYNEIKFYCLFHHLIKRAVFFEGHTLTFLDEIFTKFVLTIILRWFVDSRKDGLRWLIDARHTLI